MKIAKSMTLDLKVWVYLSSLRKGKVSEYVNRLILNEMDKKAVKRPLRHCPRCDLDTGQDYCPQCGDDVELKT
jgi:ribosomal protein S27AE